VHGESLHGDCWKSARQGGWWDKARKILNPHRSHEKRRETKSRTERNTPGRKRREGTSAPYQHPRNTGKNTPGNNATEQLTKWAAIHGRSRKKVECDAKGGGPTSRRPKEGGSRRGGLIERSRGRPLSCLRLNRG